MEELKAVEERYDSPYSGDQETAILQHAEKLKEQTTAEDGDTVQVYDVDGNPHKVAKSELLKKSTLALPNLSDISKFVAVNAKGDAVGLMTKEQVAQVLGELIGLASDEKDGLLQAGTFRYRGHQGDNGLDNIGSGYGYSYASDGSGVWGVFLSFNSDCRLQFKCSHADGSLYTRTYNQMTKEWSKWRLL